MRRAGAAPFWSIDSARSCSRVWSRAIRCQVWGRRPSTERPTDHEVIDRAKSARLKRHLHGGEVWQSRALTFGAAARGSPFSYHVSTGDIRLISEPD